MGYRSEVLIGMRGKIVDRHDEVLAKSIALSTVMVDAKLLDDPVVVVRALAYERASSEPASLEPAPLEPEAFDGSAFGGAIELVGYTLGEAVPGEPLPVILAWRSLSAVVRISPHRFGRCL